MSRLRILKNPLDGGDEILRVRTDDVLKVFKEVKKKHPQARIYITPACAQNDVTPSSKVDEASLQVMSKTHDFDIVCQAGEPATIIAIVSLVLSLAMAAYTLLTMPDPQDGVDRPSSNNQLGQRENRVRIGGRIPDIFGTVKAVPDLIAPPFRYFKNNVEIEETLMCLGRGHYQISEVKEGETSIEQINGESVSVYDPGQNLTTANPMYRYGDIMTDAPLVGRESRSITGQTLLNPSSARVVSSDITFGYPNIVYAATNAFTNGETIAIEGAKYGVADALLSGTTDISLDFVLTVATTTDIYSPDNFKKIAINALLVTDPVAGTLDLAGTYDVSSIVKSGSPAAWVYAVSLLNPETVNQNFSLLSQPATSSTSSNLTANLDSVNLDGTYTININDGTKLTLSAPDADNPDWLKLQNWGGTAGNTIGLYGTQENWLGWYETDSEADQIYANFYAPNGLYHIGEKGYKEVIGVQLELEHQAIDIFGNPVGEIFYKTQALFGNIKSIASPVGLTLTGSLLSPSRIRFRLRRTTVHTSRGTVVDEVQARSVYTMRKLEKLTHDDITIVRSQTVTNDISAGVKKRELNMLATRKLHSYASGVKSASRAATNNFADTVCAMTEDPHIGRRSVDTLDIASLYATQNAIQAYFGITKATEFNYTFDNANQSYEETLAQVASMVFCNARRDSGKVYFQFERTSPSSSILFNHRNKSPGSETRTEKFGVDNEYDGVEVKWVDPADSWTEKILKLPNENISNAKSIELSGVTNRYQAHFLAHRAWNKIQYQRETVQFTAYGEADLITINDRIAVTDDTMPTLVPLGEGSTSGDVVSWLGQVIETSQPVQLDPLRVYAIHLQLSNGSIEVMQVSQGVDEYHLTLERLPILPLITVLDWKIAATNYSITLDAEKDSEAYLVSEKSASGQFETQITAINYNPLYYSNDKDHINNLI